MIVFAAFFRIFKYKKVNTLWFLYIKGIIVTFIFISKNNKLCLLLLNPVRKQQFLLENYELKKYKRLNALLECYYGQLLFT